MTKKEAWARYNKRSFTHTGEKSERILSDTYQRTGFEGEWAFAQALGIDIDLEERPRGDGGIDFIVNDIKIDVKTSSERAFNTVEEKMLVEVGKCRSDVIYVMALYLARRKEAVILGYEHGDRIKTFPKEVSPWGVNNYCCDWMELKHPWFLYKLLGYDTLGG